MNAIESDQMPSEDMTLVYGIEPPDSDLRLRVAESIARADYNSTLQNALSIYESREKIPDFDDDVVRVLEHLILVKGKIDDESTVNGEKIDEARKEDAAVSEA